MKTYGYINGERVELDNEALEIEIERDGDDKIFHRWGGHTFVRIKVIENGKYVYTFVSGRVSGDMRAGSQRGIHLSLTVAKKNSDTRKECHVAPCWPVKE